MTTVSSINAGSRITASEIRNVAPLAAYKGADETVSTGVGTLQNDDALFLSLLANAVYKWELWLNYEGGTTGSSDLKVGWTVPSGATLKGSADYTTSGAVVEVYWTNATTLAPGTNGAAAIRGFNARGTIATTTAGTLQLQWCQNTGSAVNTTVHAGSILLAWQVSG